MVDFVNVAKFRIELLFETYKKRIEHPIDGR